MDQIRNSSFSEKNSDFHLQNNRAHPTVIHDPWIRADYSSLFGSQPFLVNQPEPFEVGSRDASDWLQNNDSRADSFEDFLQISGMEYGDQDEPITINLEAAVQFLRKMDSGQVVRNLETPFLEGMPLLAC